MGKLDELTQEEQQYLLSVLTDRLGTQREGIYHSERSRFKDEMKREEKLIRRLIEKLEFEPVLKTGS